jgi:hypothetical protein
MELLDVSDQLPALTRMPGLQSWRVKVIKLWMATIRASGWHCRLCIISLAEHAGSLRTRTPSACVM